MTKTPSNPEIPEIGKFHCICRGFFSFKILFHRENFHLLGSLGGRSQNRETPDQIGRVGTYDTVCSKSYGFSLPKSEKLSSESEELQEISLDDKLE